MGSEYWRDYYPSQKQIDYATKIAETLGIDLPEDDATMGDYADFIDENKSEYYSFIYREAYRNGTYHTWQHSYNLTEGYCGDNIFNINPTKA